MAGKLGCVTDYLLETPAMCPKCYRSIFEVFNIEAVLDQWHEPSGTYFKVRMIERKVYLLRYDGEGDEWTLQSGFDGNELFARPSIEFITVGSEVIHRAEKLTESCEHCHPGDAEIPFDWLLAEVTRKHGPFEFILAEPARCPNCKHEITEKTLTDPR
jgi:hypothetical protein